MAKTKMKNAKDLTFAEILNTKKPTTQKVPICLDPDLVTERDKLKRDLGQAEIRLGRSPEDEDRLKIRDSTKTAYELAIDAVEAATVTFEFKALGRRVIDVMMKASRPTADQVEQYHAQLKEQGLPLDSLNYDPDSFPPKLIARSCFSPKMTDEEAIELWNSDAFSEGDLGALFQAAWSVNQLVAR